MPGIIGKGQTDPTSAEIGATVIVFPVVARRDEKIRTAKDTTQGVGVVDVDGRICARIGLGGEKVFIVNDHHGCDSGSPQ